MASLLHSIQAHGCEYGPPYRGDELRVRGSALPGEFWEVARVVDGFTTVGGVFRFFRVDAIQTHNASSWATAYGSLLDHFVIVAEDIFGDLYGYALDAPCARLAKFYCEGGEMEGCVPPKLAEFLMNRVLGASPSIVDMDMLRAALDAGLRCGPDQHLAFQLPLVAGGEYSVENMGVEDRNLHMGVLGQLSVSTRRARDGAPIASFVEKKED
ncbi:MAG: hypothetical protein KC776_33270 [Myxococcales bacterium]|nr:hypothetical protein [Myxococcales bacterium]MCB9575824.1 hypothetical protein [Polyangiaceae bacterium]